MLDAVIPQSEATVRERLNAVAGTQLLSIRQQGLDTGITVLLESGEASEGASEAIAKLAGHVIAQRTTSLEEAYLGPSLSGVGWVRLEGMVDAELVMAAARIHIVGGPGSGKTTLSIRLARERGVGPLRLDDIAFDPSSGVAAPLAQRLSGVDSILAEPSWVTEGYLPGLDGQVVRRGRCRNLARPAHVGGPHPEGAPPPQAHYRWWVPSRRNAKPTRPYALHVEVLQERGSR